MSELEELHESAEHAHEDPELARVSFTMAILAVLVALATLLGHRAHTEELLLQTRAADTWAEYQAKNIRHTMYELISGLVSTGPARAQTSAQEKQQHQWENKEKQLDTEKEELQTEARKLESEVAVEQKRATRFDISEALLEMALVVTSISLLTRRLSFWFVGIFLGVIGLAPLMIALF